MTNGLFSYSKLGNDNRQCSVTQAHHLLMNFEEPLKDYVRAVQSIKVSGQLCLYEKVLFYQSKKKREGVIYSTNGWSFSVQCHQRLKGKNVGALVKKGT